ncbi:MAG: ribbon-helix-helix domain-containing protein [Myxococcales bacterium]|nr:ribbon-helix-helix domain-containing protein [Myxococcales bacterium]
MARRKISTTVYIHPEQDEKLKILSDRLQRPVAEFIREAIDMFLEAHRNQLPVQLDLLPPRTASDTESSRSGSKA